MTRGEALTQKLQCVNSSLVLIKISMKGPLVSCCAQVLGQAGLCAQEANIKTQPSFHPTVDNVAILLTYHILKMGLTDLGFRLTQLEKTLSGLICFVFSSQTDKITLQPIVVETAASGGGEI